jgi:hypothetical protein
MKNDLTTGTWQDDIGCPINIILLCTSDVATDNVIAKLFGTVNTFHHSYSQRILRYALQRTFTFLWNIKT